MRPYVARHSALGVPSTAPARTARMVARADGRPGRLHRLALPIRAARRGVAQLFSHVLAALLSSFFFGSPALAAASKSVAASTPPTALPIVAAGASVSVVLFALSRALGQRAAGPDADDEALVGETPASAAPVAASDADDALMSSLRERMMSLTFSDEEDGDMGTATGGDASGEDGDMDDLVREVRAARADYPISGDSGTALLDKPDEGATASDEAPTGLDTAPGRPEDVAFLEKLFAQDAEGKGE